MSTAAMRTRLAKLEKRRKRLDGRELTEVQMARWIGYCLTCAANGYGTEAQREHGRRIAITFARNRTRRGEDFSPGLSNLLLRALVGEVSATNGG